MGSPTPNLHNLSHSLPLSVVPLPRRSQGGLVVTTRGSPLVRVVRVAGEVDLLTAAMLADHIAACLAGGTPLIVVVDLRRVDYLAAAGLSVLAAADHQARVQHTSLRLVVTTRPVLRVLSVTGLDHMLAIYPALEAALTPDGEVEHRVDC